MRSHYLGIWMNISSKQEIPFLKVCIVSVNTCKDSVFECICVLFFTLFCMHILSLVIFLFFFLMSYVLHYLLLTIFLCIHFHALNLPHFCPFLLKNLTKYTIMCLLPCLCKIAQSQHVMFYRR